jgi:dienelactone hydrolase
MTLINSFLKLDYYLFPKGVFWKAPENPRSSPAVVVMHELDGMTISFLEFANRLVERGFTVYLPLFFGEIGEPNLELKPSLNTVKSICNTINFASHICISKEFNAFKTGEASPITQSIRELCKHVYTQNGHNQFPGIGAVGMCLTGGFVLSMLLEPEVVAPVAGHPSLPFGLTPSLSKSLGLSSEELEKVKQRVADTDLLFVRFAEDQVSPQARQKTLEDTFGCSLKKVVITAEQRKQEKIPRIFPLYPHSALAGNFADQNHKPYQCTEAAFEQVAQFLKKRLMP